MQIDRQLMDLKPGSWVEVSTLFFRRDVNLAELRWRQAMVGEVYEGVTVPCASVRVIYADGQREVISLSRGRLRLPARPPLRGD